MWKRIVEHLSKPSKNAYKEIHYPNRLFRYMSSICVTQMMYESLTNIDTDFNQPSKPIDKLCLVFLSSLGGYIFPWLGMGGVVYQKYDSYIGDTLINGKEYYFDKTPGSVSFTYYNVFRTYQFFRNNDNKDKEIDKIEGNVVKFFLYKSKENLIII
jgi:hypothetical protein